MPDIPPYLLADSGIRAVRSVKRAMQRALIRAVGPRIWLVPRSFRRWALSSTSMSRAERRSIVRAMAEFADWVDCWTRAGERFEADGRIAAASASYLAAARAISRFDHRRRPLVERARMLYLDRDDLDGVVIERVPISWGGAEMPVRLFRRGSDADGPRSCVVMFGGIDEPMERFHPWVLELLDAGHVVVTAGFTEPWCGDDHIERYVRELLDLVVRHPAVHPRHVHLVGNCAGAGLAVGAASMVDAASLTTISVICSVDDTPWREDAEVLRAFAPGMELSDPPTAAELDRFRAEFDLRDWAPLVTCPTLAFHGVFDLVAPLRGSMRLADEVQGESVVRVFLTQGHGCHGRQQRMRAELLAHVHAADLRRRGEPRATNAGTRAA